MANNSRRSFFTQIGAGSLAAIVARPVLAQTERRGGSSLSAKARSAKAEGPPAKSWSQEYWTQKGDVKLYMFRKRRAAPKAGERPLPVLFLVHGSSLSGRPTFDLTVPGRGEDKVIKAVGVEGQTNEQREWS